MYSEKCGYISYEVNSLSDVVQLQICLRFNRRTVCPQGELIRCELSELH